MENRKIGKEDAIFLVVLFLNILSNLLIRLSPNLSSYAYSAAADGSYVALDIAVYIPAVLLICATTWALMARVRTATKQQKYQQVVWAALVAYALSHIALYLSGPYAVDEVVRSTHNFDIWSTILLSAPGPLVVISVLWLLIFMVRQHDKATLPPAPTTQVPVTPPLEPTVAQVPVWQPATDRIVSEKAAGIFTTLLLISSPIPIVWWLVTASGILLLALIFVHSSIARFTTWDVNKHFTLARIFVGGIASLPISLIAGLFIPIGFTVHLVVVGMTVLLGLLIGDMAFPNKESVADPAKYKKAVLSCMYLAIGIVIIFSIISFAFGPSLGIGSNFAID
jgi:hypothetical protein